MYIYMYIAIAREREVNCRLLQDKWSIEVIELYTYIDIYVYIGNFVISNGPAKLYVAQVVSFKTIDCAQDGCTCLQLY